MLISACVTSRLTHERGEGKGVTVESYKLNSIFLKVPSACSKKPYTMLLENSRSSSSSSISRICSNVTRSILSPHSGRLGYPSSDYSGFNPSTIFLQWSSLQLGRGFTRLHDLPQCRIDEQRSPCFLFLFSYVREHLVTTNMHKVVVLCYWRVVRNGGFARLPMG